MKKDIRAVEGTWEEIQKQASKFAGRRVRVTILPRQLQRAEPTDEDTAQFLREFAGAWAGDDLDECLEMVYDTRTATRW